MSHKKSSNEKVLNSSTHLIRICDLQSVWSRHEANRRSEDGCGIYIRPSCGLKMDEEDYEYEFDEEVEWTVW